MHRPRLVATVLAAATVLTGLAVGGPPAGADGTSAVALSCQAPVVGATTTSVDVTATDSADPILVDGSVTNTVKVPVPALDDLPISVTVKEVKMTTPIPAGVTVTGVTFTPSSFTGTTWAVTGGNLVVTLTGSIPLSPGGTPPAVPEVRTATTIGGSPRTVSWKVPSSITAKADTFLGSQTASCVPANPNQVLITTTVEDPPPPNRPPVPVEPSLETDRGTALPITLSATDPDGDALTYAVTTGPGHGTVTGTAPTLTYTPTPGYIGTDSFGFSVSDGEVTVPGLVALIVRPAPPGAPTITGPPTALAGAVRLSWAAPADTGGFSLFGYRVTPIRAGVPQAPIVFDSTATTQLVTGLDDGIAYTFRVAAFHEVAIGSASAPSASVTPQGWRPFASWGAAVDRIHQWMIGRLPTATERSTWVSHLQAGTHTLPDLVVALRRGPLHAAVVDPVTRLYQAYFLRVPDRAGITFWVDRRQAGVTLAKVSDGFARSSEFVAQYGPLTNRAFVERIYQNVLGRPGEPGGVTYWAGELDAGRRTRGSVMVGFSESPEYRGQQAAAVDAAVLVIYLEARTPTLAERTATANRLRTGVPLTTIVRETLRTPAVVGRA